MNLRTQQSLAKMDKIADGLNKLSQLSGDKIVESSRFIESESLNRVSPPKPASNNEEATKDYMFRQTITGQPVDTTELDDAQERLIQSYIEHYVKRALGV